MQNTIPVTFMNEDGYKLFGILHKASRKVTQDTGVIILSPGVKSRVAPHRLYVKMAKRFSELGFDVLRFDFYGLGDSEGEVQEKYMADFYGTVQVGRYIDDTISAMDWMEKGCNVSRFILTGLCGGAITGLLVGARDKRVAGLIGLGIPVILDGVNVDHTKYMTNEQLKATREGYIKNLFDFQRLIRFITFRSDYKMIFKSVVQPITKKFSNFQGRLNAAQASGKSLQQLNSNFNPYFPQAFHMMISSRKVLMIFSEADRLYWEFEEKYMRPYQQEFKKYKSNIEIHLTKNANHIFSFKEWQEDMLDRSCSWLNRYYG